MASASLRQIKQSSSVSMQAPTGQQTEKLQLGPCSVFAVGQGMVDYSFKVDDTDLVKLGATMGGRRVVTSDEVLRILEYFAVQKGQQIQSSGGGSLNNTLVWLSKLREAFEEVESSDEVLSSNHPIKRHMNFVGMVCSDFYERHYEGSRVVEHIKTLEPWENTPSAHGLTIGNGKIVPGPNSGTVIVLVTEDGQRSFLSDPKFGIADFTVTDDIRLSLQNSQWLFIEGYLLEHGNVMDKLADLCSFAKANNVRVALSAGDASIVSRAQQRFTDLLIGRPEDSKPLVDVLFANAEEANALIQALNSGADSIMVSRKPAGWDTYVDVPSRAAALAEHVSVAVVTDGESGSYIAAGKQPPYPEAPIVEHIGAVPAERVDTCGAGDAYAAGFMHALLAMRSSSLQDLSAENYRTVGTFASHMASIVVAQPGSAPEADSVTQLTNLVKDLHLKLSEQEQLRLAEAPSQLHLAKLESQDQHRLMMAMRDAVSRTADPYLFQSQRQRQQLDRQSPETLQTTDEDFLPQQWKPARSSQVSLYAL